MVDLKKTVEKESYFNMAVAVLKRIDELLTAAAYFSYRRELNNWFNILLTLKRQIQHLFDKEEKETNKIFCEELYRLDNQYKAALTNKRINQFKSYGRFLKLLDSYEEFLRTCLEKRDMMMRGKENLGEAVTET